METKKSLWQNFLQFTEKQNTKRVVIGLTALALIFYWISKFNYQCLDSILEVYWCNIPLLSIWVFAAVLYPLSFLFISFNKDIKPQRLNSFILILLYFAILIFFMPFIQSFFAFIIFAFASASLLFFTFKRLMSYIFNANIDFDEEILSHLGAAFIVVLLIILAHFIDRKINNRDQIAEAHKTGILYEAADDAKVVGDDQYLIPFTNGEYVVTTSEEGKETKAGHKIMVTFDKDKDYPFSKGFDNLNVELCK